MAGIDQQISNVSTREFVERRVAVLEEHTTSREVQSRTKDLKAEFASFQKTHFVKRNPEEPFKNLTASPQAPQDLRNLKKFQEGIGDLGYVTILSKLDQARAEPDLEKRGHILVDAQMLMTEYLNIGRDPALPTAVKEKIRDTLQDYLKSVKALAPNYVDLPYVMGADCSPQESYWKLESLVKKDPDLAGLNTTWEERKKGIGG